MSIKNNFENILGFKIPQSEYNRIFRNTLQPHMNGRKINWKQYYLKSNGKFSDACQYLYKESQKININNFENSDSISSISNDIKKNGYSVISNFINDEQIEMIRRESHSFKFFDSESNPIDGHPSQKKLKNIHPLYYSNLTGSVIQPSSGIGKLIVNDMLAKISWKYFDLNPYLTSLVYLFSPNINRELNDVEIKGSAQSFHFDYSHFKFLKFFIYLTDVKEDSGAHEFVRGSHGHNLKYPKQASDFISCHRHPNGSLEGQVKEGWVVKNYEQNNIIRHCYPKGTLIIEDTSGLHKGGKVESGTREMLSLIYCISNYGAYPPDNQPEVDVKDDLNYLSPLSSSTRAEQISSFNRHNKLSLYEKFYGKIKRRLAR